MGQDIHKVPLGVKIASSGWTVYSVNGTAVRNTHDAQFSGFGIGGDAPYIPEQEIWIENTRPFDEMLTDVTAAEKRALELEPEPVEMEKQSEPPPPDAPSIESLNLSKVANGRFWKGVQYITKTADWPDQHHKELERGLSAYFASMGGGQESQDNSSKGILTWLFGGGPPEDTRGMQGLMQGLGKVPRPVVQGSETSTRATTNDAWGQTERAGIQSSGGGGSPV